MTLLFGLRLHWGDPKHPTEIRAWTGALGNNDHPWTHCYVSHELNLWFGFSFKRRWFAGFMLIRGSQDYRTKEPPRFGWGSEIGERPSDIPGEDACALIAQAEGAADV